MLGLSEPSFWSPQFARFVCTIPDCITHTHTPQPQPTQHRRAPIQLANTGDPHKTSPGAALDKSLQQRSNPAASSLRASCPCLVVAAAVAARRMRSRGEKQVQVRKLQQQAQKPALALALFLMQDRE